MRAMICTAIALMFTLTSACGDRDRDDTASRVDNTAEEAGEDVREGTEDVADATGDAAENAAEATEDAAEGAANATEDAAEDAADDSPENSYQRREEFRRDVRQRLDQLDEELAQLERDTREGADEARVEAIAAARNARQVVGRHVDRLANATAENWEELKQSVSESLDSAERRVQALRPDAKPMGGTGGPN
jgi:uncharacterized phage infection (PIP) family protein YhgE